MKQFIIPSLIVATGIALAGYFTGSYYYHTKMDFRTVTVKGLAEKNVRANLAVWNIRFQSAGNELVAAKQKIES